jgi:hypothetical protein
VVLFCGEQPLAEFLSKDEKSVAKVRLILHRFRVLQILFCANELIRIKQLQLPAQSIPPFNPP